MATEPIVTSDTYISTELFTPPVGRLPVLGKARASIDQARAQIASILNEIKNRDAAQALATLKTNAEIALMEIQGTNDTIKTANDTARLGLETDKVGADITALQERTASEVQLLEQKTATELANTSNVIPTTIGIDSTGAARTTFNKASPYDSVGIVGKQQQLYAAQAAGFERDAEQKLAKIYVDAFSIQASVSTVPDPVSSGLSTADIKAVLTTARTNTGIGANV